MSYQGQKPFGRRRTDKPLSDEEHQRLQTIRRDVDEDASGQIRRYLRLASKALDGMHKEGLEDGNSFASRLNNSRRDRAA